MSNDTFRYLAKNTNKDLYQGYLITLDPGETTGYCVMHDFQVVQAGQLITSDLDLGYDALSNLFHVYQGKEEGVRVVCEDYRVYSWKSKQHEWAGLHTPKLIGMIHCLAIQYGFPAKYVMAVEAKTFVTDEKLKDWGLWIPNQRHARDAIRHAVLYTIFGESDGKINKG